MIPSGGYAVGPAQLWSINKYFSANLNKGLKLIGMKYLLITRIQREMKHSHRIKLSRVYLHVTVPAVAWKADESAEKLMFIEAGQSTAGSLTGRVGADKEWE